MTRSKTPSPDPTGDLFSPAAEGPPAGTPPLGQPPQASGNGDEALDLSAFVERSYLEYAMSVVMGRALPDVADGQKPVQRRILFAMHELGLYRPARHVKSARVVGDVIGKYHPHGDSAAYEALVRQAQDFSLRYPLIDGQGNFGSRDGDGAAAMRYTECRLTPVAELLLSEIDRDTVDFGPNYDGSFQEPKLLPARLPMLLLNGAAGIGVGMATEIPSHNLVEVGKAAIALLRDPDLPLPKLLKIIKGPDLPGGGQIISSPEDIAAAYASGRGSLKTRARWIVEELARGQWRVVVTELPYGVSARDVLEDVEKVTNPRPREGKKSLSPEQANLKALMLGALDTVRDESDKQSPVRLVFEPKSSRQEPQEFVNLLLAHTRLESNLPINLVLLGRDGQPRQKDLRTILVEWVDFRYQTVVRRSRHRLNEVERRIHILEGRQLALLHIDEVIRVIRESDEPKAALMSQFGLTEVQAEDILEIRLRQLARLEGIKIEQELKSLKAERRDLRHLLDHRDAQTELLCSEIEADVKQYGDARRTLIEAVEATVVAPTVLDEPVTITLSRNGWIRSRQGHQLDAAQFGYKAGDGPLAVMETRTVHAIVVLDTQGRAYTVKASDIPGGRGDGVPVTTLIDLQAGARVCRAFAVSPGERYLVAGSGGAGFLVAAEDLVSRVKGGKAFLTLEADETPIPAARCLPQFGQVAALSEKGRLLVFAADELRAMPRGRGVILMGLDRGEALLSVCPVGPGGVAVHGVNRAGTEVLAELTPAELKRYQGTRARKGTLLDYRMKPRSLEPLGT
ncbi:MAG: DNA topoisomerase IV subunit A [Betaproteobacteria bacterium]|nr:DNA topoisomerase IV subunit A [Betaproteobacteria bacterium]